jgi:hypothetical protein
MRHYIGVDHEKRIASCLNCVRVASAVISLYRLHPPKHVSARLSALFAHRVLKQFWHTSVRIAAVNWCRARGVLPTNWIAIRHRLIAFLKAVVVFRPNEFGGETRNQCDALNAQLCYRSADTGEHCRAYRGSSSHALVDAGYPRWAAAGLN